MMQFTPTPMNTYDVTRPMIFGGRNQTMQSDANENINVLHQYSNIPAVRMAVNVAGQLGCGTETLLLKVMAPDASVDPSVYRETTVSKTSGVETVGMDDRTRAFAPSQYQQPLLIPPRSVHSIPDAKQMLDAPIILYPQAAYVSALNDAYARIKSIAPPGFFVNTYGSYSLNLNSIAQMTSDNVVYMAFVRLVARIIQRNELLGRSTRYTKVRLNEVNMEIFEILEKFKTLTMTNDPVNVTLQQQQQHTFIDMAPNIVSSPPPPVTMTPPPQSGGFMQSINMQ